MLRTVSRPIIAVAATASLLSMACGSIGPPRIPHDRFDYGEAIARAWREQMLLNIVKLRYSEMPMFIEVSIS